MSIQKVLLFVFALLASFCVHANVVLPKIICVNGIANSEKDAKASCAAVKSLMNRGKGMMPYEVVAVYNPKGLYDKHELLQLKSSEEMYIASLRKLACRFDDICTVDYDAARAVTEHLFQMNKSTNSSTSTIGGKEKVQERMSHTRQAVLALAEEIKKHRMSVVVAHSEGNIIANLAFAHLATRQQMGDDIYNRVRIINVANTSLIALSGLDLTHDKDGALAALDTLPTTFMRWKRTTPYCNDAVCKFTRTKPTLHITNLPNPAELKNQLSAMQAVPETHHRFIGTYMSEKLEVDIVKGEHAGVRHHSEFGVTFADRFRIIFFTAAASFFNELSLTKPPEPPVKDENLERVAQGLIDEWISSHPGLRRPTPGDLESDMDSFNRDVERRRELGYNEDPFFAVGDFNGDGHMDVVATYMDEKNRYNNFNGADQARISGVVIINGPLATGMSKRAFNKGGICMLYCTTIKYSKKYGLSVGKWESSSQRVRYVSGNKYTIKFE